ncbi:phenylalanine 4-monooxygenase [Paracraurococcus ruber]|uniref:phenylalanine 4-monooxygenase n=1 Tax=Paracraurococcus ruber TaxID=77675 RepID=A0ABS1CW44_9PROT|nr:phenylalanine 4-monooxygenase [Paracraurococcus ruber]MBK1658461.1 phenylalanine 4-monooxygenase [Paracraurococcus ruber]TDG16332.1 phenylalanine 4-monooxygenase [Paracraurococcus ruber]
MEAKLWDLPDGLRGDYAAARADFTLPQRWADYTDAEHGTWRALYRRQAGLLPQHAAAAFRDGLRLLDFAGGIPDFAVTSARLRAATGWTLVAVPGLLPDGAFFGHLAERRFPVTRWIRRPEELDYVVEPDIFHDAFGHVPLLAQPDFADMLEAYGRLGEQAARIGALKPLARFYWHMVEFGLVREAGQLRAYGAGILSSSAETVHATHGAAPRRLRFDARRVLRSDYLIDALQPTYFVIDSYAALFAAMRDLPSLLAGARDAAPIAPGGSAPGDTPIA